jgi:hypothetical protein
MTYPKGERIPLQKEKCGRAEIYGKCLRGDRFSVHPLL